MRRSRGVRVGLPGRIGTPGSIAAMANVPKVVVVSAGIVGASVGDELDGRGVAR